MDMIKFSNCNCEVEKGKFDVNNIPLDCPATWNLISSGFTKGVFQLETRLGSEWARKVKPSNIKELAALTAIIRPSALECLGGDTKILRRRYYQNGRKRYHYEYCTIKELYNEYLALQKHYIKMREGLLHSKQPLYKEETREEIRKLLVLGELTQKEIGRIYGVKQPSISRIKLHKSFRKTKNKEVTRKLGIISLNEETKELFNNKIISVIKNGTQKTYKLKIRNSYKILKHKERNFNINATGEHLFLTKNGWKKLKDIKPGDYVATINKWSGKYRSKNKHSDGWKNFKNIAFYHYEYSCIFCDWNQTSLDVHHIYNTRYIDNNKDNLVWLCPNHHRMCTENQISADEIKKQREKYRLHFSKDFKYVQIIDIEDCEEEETYDIQVEGPNHNYIAGDFIVHNSGQAEEYVDIKFGKKQQSYLHSKLENILKDTYGTLIYQEQSLKIAQEIAGFSLEDADQLRVAIGKKKVDLMASLKNRFIEGCQKNSGLSKEISEQIFGWIEKSQRYQFNYSHAVSYGMLSYTTSYLKTHFPHEFFTSYLTFSNYKGDPKQEVYELVQDARLFGINILPPDIKTCNIHFKMIEDEIKFGLSNIRGIGQSSITKIIEQSKSLSTFNEFLKSLSILHRGTGIALIKSGACDCYNMERSQMAKELEIVFGTTIKNKEGKNEEIRGLTEKERAWFFNKLIDNRSIKDVLFEMVQQAENSPGKSLSSLKKEDIVNWSKKILGEQFDFSGMTKIDITNRLKENGYNEESMKSCIVGKRLQIIKNKLEQLKINEIDTNLAKSVAEKYFLGIALSCSPADDVDDSSATHNCLDLMKCLNGESFSSVVVIDSVKHTKTKKGKNPGAPMCFLTMSDSSYSIDHSVVFPDVYEKMHGLCKDGLICLVTGYKKNGSIIVQNLQKLI